MKNSLLLFACYWSFITLAYGQAASLHQDVPLQGSEWVSIPYKEGTAKRPCPVFKKNFKLERAGKKIRKSILYITALGIYEATLNGKRVGNAYFTPGFTNYTKRLQYQVYDVTRMLDNLNSLEVTVGEGWYRGTFRNLESDRSDNNYGNETGLIAELQIIYADGSVEKIHSDKSWLCRESKIRHSELYDGEFYDAGFIPGNWTEVKLLNHPKDILIPSITEPVNKQETLKPIKVFKTPKDEQVADFGQNLAGWVRLEVNGKKGDTVRLSHAEVLDSAGNFNTTNLRSAKAVDTYILSKSGTSVFEPHFTYHGFRYVKLEGTQPLQTKMTAIALYSDLKKTGTFSCSDPMINQLQSNIEWSLNSNFFDIPTDCPQRSERLGWTGDAQVFAATASYLRDTKNFYKKWLADLATEQRTNGSIPRFIPTSSPLNIPVNGLAGWGDAATIIPWTVYQTYNDTSVLQHQYASMKAWVDYIQHESEDGLWQADGYGDWYAMGDFTSLPFIDQCYFAHSTELVLKAAEVLGKTEDVKTYSTLLNKVKSAFNRAYAKFDTKATTTQTAYVLALAFDLLPENQRKDIAEKLVQKIKDNGNKLATGFLGTPELLPVLSRFGYSDVAYKLLMQKSCPSWLYPITKGATTIWERWDAITTEGTVQQTSFNHYAYGAVGRWLYENVAGIRSSAPGYSSIIIKPEIGGGLTWAKGSYICNYGKIVSEWKLIDKKIIMRVEIPEGVTATVFVPGKDSLIIKSGKYTFEGLAIKSESVHN